MDEIENGCGFCKDGKQLLIGIDSLARAGYVYMDENMLVVDSYSDLTNIVISYCPMCGRELKEGI